MRRTQKRAGGKKIVLRKHCLLFINLTVRSTQDEAAAGAATALASATEVQSKTKNKNVTFKRKSMVYRLTKNCASNSAAYCIDIGWKKMRFRFTLLEFE